MEQGMPTAEATGSGEDGVSPFNGGDTQDSAHGLALFHHRPSVHNQHPQHRTVGELDISVRSGRSLASVASSKITVQVDVAEDEPPLSVQLALDEEYEHPHHYSTLGHKLRAFGRKLRGGLDRRPKVPHLQDLFFSWLGAFVGIAVVSLLDRALWSAIQFPLLVASFGASAVLLYGVPESKLAQPWNVVGGQIISSVIGVCVRLALAHHVPWLANALGMSIALVAMQLTTTTHPPGGATALIACSAPITAPWHGFQFCVTVSLGSVIMTFIAFITNNLCRDRSYPTYWF